MSIRTAILISGGGSNMVALVDSMPGDHPARPCLVFSNNPDAGGLAKAKARDVPTAVVDHKPFKGDRVAFEDALHAKLVEAKVELICNAGFMRILTEGFVNKWAGRMLNIHPSLLPKSPGRNTHARALEAGDSEAGDLVITGKVSGLPPGTVIIDIDQAHARVSRSRGNRHGTRLPFTGIVE